MCRYYLLDKLPDVGLMISQYMYWAPGRTVTIICKSYWTEAGVIWLMDHSFMIWFFVGVLVAVFSERKVSLNVCCSKNGSKIKYTMYIKNKFYYHICKAALNCFTIDSVKIRIIIHWCFLMYWFEHKRSLRNRYLKNQLGFF